MMIRDPEQGVEHSGKMAAARPAAVIRGSGRHTGPERPRSDAEHYGGSRSSYFLNGQCLSERNACGERQFPQGRRRFRQGCRTGVKDAIYRSVYGLSDSVLND